MKNIKNTVFISLLLITILLSSCWTENTSSEISFPWTTTIENNSLVSDESTENTNTETEVVLEEKTLDLKTSSNELEKIILNWDSITYLWDNAFVSWTKLTITKAWNYEISWTLNDWQIVVETDDDKAVKIILNWVNLSNSSSSVIFVENAKQTIIELASWTTNTITDGEDYVFDSDDDEPNAAIFSRDELVITWEWKLVVEANYNDWIASKDELYIESWEIVVNSVDDGIRWKDYLQIDGWIINLTASWDALKADNEEKWQIYINWWDIEISAWDDAVHAEMSLTVNDWNINITKSYEWLESKLITLNWWNIDIVSSDDGINVAWWNDWSWMMEWGKWDFWWERPEQNSDFEDIRTIMDKQRNWETLTNEEQALIEEMQANRQQRDQNQDFWGMPNNTWWESSTNSSYYLYINWWNINVNASWDWLDSNGSIVMTWWEVYVAWPTSSGNWFLDYDVSFDISGWTLISYWSSWMLQNVSTSSSQNWVAIWFDSTASTWTEFILKDSSWNVIFETNFIKNTQATVVSSPLLKTWEIYSYYLDWELMETFTIDSITTTVWNVKSGWFGGWRGMK